MFLFYQEEAIEIILTKINLSKIMKIIRKLVNKHLLLEHAHKLG